MSGRTSRSSSAPTASPSSTCRSPTDERRTQRPHRCRTSETSDPYSRDAQGGNMAGVRMPEGKKMACCLCFDVDALSLWLGLFRFTTANPLSRGEFEGREGIPRVLDLLDKYNLK